MENDIGLVQVGNFWIVKKNIVEISELTEIELDGKHMLGLTLIFKNGKHSFILIRPSSDTESYLSYYSRVKEIRDSLFMDINTS